MPPDDILTDDHVAELLVKEANDCSLKYSSMGLDAFKSTKRPANQPKPNTRFLNNIIRDTNHHNRTLLARESAESRAKLRDLEDAEEKKRREEERRQRKSRPGPGDTRKRMLGNIAAILGAPSKKRRAEKADVPGESASDSEEPTARASNSHRRHGSHRRNEDTDIRRGHGRKDQTTESGGASHHKRRRDESREDRSSSSRPREHKRRRYSPHRDSSHRTSPAKRLGHQHLPSDSSSDSDPLDEVIGPAPAKTNTVQPRGRGANASTAGIDSRFAPDYDPRKDVTPEPKDGDSWDNDVEAFRDRQKWKQQGADRLRSAGFTEEQIKKWEKGDQKDEEDVQWTKTPGLREWDRGKVVNQDGTVTFATDAE
ncbi:hypothetical protein M426DRAFT_318006 [Hypoxylon sp. CI-4A]|nr:hypothetical protein M426DRAFT_318006 [Hypoxylon sp. CI-4A]